MKRSTPLLHIPALLLLLAAPASRASAAGSPVPDMTRLFGTWLWVQSDGLISTSTPETKGVERTLVLSSDLTYELHQRRDTVDSLLCRGQYLFSEETAEGRQPVDYLQFANWYETYESHMAADFEGTDSLYLAGAGCDNCPEHLFVRGSTESFEGTVASGGTYRHDLWDGLRFELDPSDLGWTIAIRDTARPGENLARLTPPLHGPNPTQIEGWHFRDANAPQRSREFLFSPEVGKSIPAAGPDGEVTADDVERVGQRGRGTLDIQSLELTPPLQGQQAGIRSMRFRAVVQEVRPASAFRNP